MPDISGASRANSFPDSADQEHMHDRRVEPRMLCADLVTVEWRDTARRLRRCTGNLEDISVAGACIQVERSFALGTAVRMIHAKHTCEGIVKYCVFRETGFFLGVEFAPGSHWSKHKFRPQHLLDPRKLAMQPERRKGRSLL